MAGPQPGRGAVVSGGAVLGGQATPPLSQPTAKKPRRRRTKAEEALGYERLVQHIGTHRSQSDEAHQLIDNELEAETRRRREAAQEETSNPGLLAECQDPLSHRERCLAARLADPLGDLWGYGRLPTGITAKYGAAEHTAPGAPGVLSQDFTETAKEARPAEYRRAFTVNGRAPKSLPRSEVDDGRAFFAWVRGRASPAAPTQEPATDVAASFDGQRGIDDHDSVPYYYGIMITDAQFEKFASDAEVPVAALRAFVSEWHKKAAEEVTHHAQPPLPPALTGPDEGRNGPSEHPSHNPSKGAAVPISELAKVAEIGDGILLRQWHAYKQLLSVVVLPTDGRFKSIEEARTGAKLVNTYHRARQRQEKIGVEVVPENDAYVGKVKTATTMFYYHTRPDRSPWASLG
jgi:hypothetical protein